MKKKALRDKAGLENYGLWLLSQRDMSRYSVKQKFMQMAQDRSDIEPILDKLEEYGYLNDERFAENYARGCREVRSYGPIKIKFKLKEKGIAERLIAQYVDDKDEAWHQLAFNLRERKFGDIPPDYETKSKQSKFLLSRGFSFDHVKSAFSKSFSEQNAPEFS